MTITRESTVQEILSACPDAREVFLQHGVEIDLECQEEVWDNTLDVCEVMCHLDDVDALIHNLQVFVDTQLTRQ